MGGPLSARHVSKRVIFHFRIQILGVTWLGVLQEHLHQWSQPSNPTATCAQRVALSLALQTQSQN